MTQIRNRPKGRQKGVVNKVTKEIRAITGALFDERYWVRVQERLWSGRLHPAIEKVLLAYAYGEPKQKIDLNATIATHTTVLHKHEPALDR